MLHQWLVRYEAGGLEALEDRSHRPRSCPHQIDAEVKVAILQTILGWAATRSRQTRAIAAGNGRSAPGPNSDGRSSSWP